MFPATERKKITIAATKKHSNRMRVIIYMYFRTCTCHHRQYFEEGQDYGPVWDESQCHCQCGVSVVIGVIPGIHICPSFNEKSNQGQLVLHGKAS